MDEPNPDYKPDSQFYDYLMTVNNYYTPKLYDVTNSDLKFIKINFTDSFGEEIKLKYNTTETVDEVDESVVYKAAFRMECELAIIE
jgi:predicted esterase YcpF (UPF0227 family)